MRRTRFKKTKCASGVGLRRVTGRRGKCCSSKKEFEIETAGERLLKGLGPPIQACEALRGCRRGHGGSNIGCVSSTARLKIMAMTIQCVWRADEEGRRGKGSEMEMGVWAVFARWRCEEGKE